MKPNFDAMTKTELRAYLVSHQDDQAAFYAFVDRFTSSAPQEIFPFATSDAEIEEVKKIIQEKVKQQRNSQ